VFRDSAPVRAIRLLAGSATPLPRFVSANTTRIVFAPSSCRLPAVSVFVRGMEWDLPLSHPSLYPIYAEAERQNLAMAVLMEAASIMVIRPAEEQLGIWARAKRLGVLGPEYDALRTDVMRLFADVAATRAAPATAAAKGKGLRTRTKALLTQQKELAKKLGESFRTRPEAAEVETEVKRVIDEIDQRIAAMEDAGLLLELELTPVGDTHGVLSYKPGTDVPAKMKAFFRDPQGAEPTVEEVEPGVYKVEVPSLKMKYLLFPEGTTPPSPLVAELAPKTPLNLNTATTGQIELTFKGEGIGKKLAEEIVKLRQQKGGSFDSIDQLKEVSGIDDTLLGKIKAKAIVAPKQSIDKVQTGLLGRRKAIVEQADFYGIDDPALQIVRALKPKDFQKLTEAELAEVDKKIAVAEKSAGEKIAKARIKEIDDATKRLGAKGIAELRQDQLASMSNEEVADALHEARTPAGKTRPNLGVPELRGILHARRKGVDVRRLLDIGEGKSMVERNWVLSKAGEMFELGILNVDKMLGEMSQTSDKWDGGRFVMEVAYFDCGGINNILAFEFRVQIDSKNYRDVDIVLKTSPRMIEVKEWTVWSSDRADKLADQHIRDVQFSNYDPAVYQNLRIVFRNPTPASIERIRADIRSRLETALDKAAKTGGITRERVRDLLAAFDKKTDLVVMSDARRVGSAPVAPPPGVPIPGKPPGEKKDDNVAPPIPVPGTATP
jgi:competence ComEA-like helix-hairpin-helix protein